MYFAIEKSAHATFPLIILESSICDKGVLSEGLMSRRGLCVDGVMYGGGFVREGFIGRGFNCPGFVYSHVTDVRRVSATDSGGYFSFI